ncbi:hypothetical protein FS837_007679 [Tulasnella sp. UAMH 9824]|nr:hypothetical protein FS837_007679 [Tulasnella sp. UAMH 9824]
MQILDPPVSGYNYLGVTHYSDAPVYTRFGPNSTASAGLTCLMKPNDQGRVASLRKDDRGGIVSGKSRAAIWNILADLTMVPIVEESGCEYAMIPFVWDDTRLIVLVANCESYKADFKGRPGGRVKLILEPA